MKTCLNDEKYQQIQCNIMLSVSHSQIWMNCIDLMTEWGMVQSPQYNVTLSKSFSQWNCMPHYWPVTPIYGTLCRLRLNTFPHPIKVNLLKWFLEIRINATLCHLCLAHNFSWVINDNLPEWWEISTETMRNYAFCVLF